MRATNLPAAFALLTAASASPDVVPFRRQAVNTSNPYAPTSTSCPSSLIRDADSTLNSEEQAYIEQRMPKAGQALSTWLTQALPGIPTEQLPTLALALSGGGPKAGMTSAGAVYGLDGRESSDSPVAGLLQSMTYMSALSGGSLTLSGIMANNFEKISTLRGLLDTSYQNALAAILNNADDVRTDVGNKSAARFPTTFVDIYGKVISYNFISSTGGSNFHWSDITSQSTFQDYEAPYPIITITQVNVAEGMCFPSNSSAIWEISPAEFGSFDEMVSAFYPTKYMGTRSNSSDTCVAGFDNVGFISATSSNILIPTDNFCTEGNFTTSQLNNTLASAIATVFPNVTLTNPYAIIPNPFYQSSVAGAISDQEDIYGTDGGYSGQGVPIFPWLQPERAVDVVFVVDAATALPHNITNGSSIYATYLSAQQKGLPRMPFVPTSDQVVEQNLTSSAQFYGCHDKSVATIIYLPNTVSGDAPTEFRATAEQVNSTIAAGVAMVTQSQSGDSDWASCLACAIVHKNATSLPDVCTGCLEKYCWPRSTETNGTTNGTAPSSPSSSPTSSTGAADSARYPAGVLAGAGVLLAILL